MKNLIENLLSNTEDIMVILSTRIGPWLAPIVPAYFVGMAMHNQLHAWPIIAICGALAVEMVGMATTHTALKAWAWNKNKRKVDPKAPLWFCIGMSGFYFAGAISLTIVSEILPSTIVFAPAIFIVLAIVSMVTIAIQLTLRQWHNDRYNKPTRQKSRHSATSSDINDKATTVVRRQKVAEMANNGVNTEDIADAFGVNVRTIQRDIKALNGAIK